MTSTPSCFSSFAPRTFVFILALLTFCTVPASGQWEGSEDIYYEGGNVGIGTAPSKNLHISRGEPVIRLQNSGSSRKWGNRAGGYIEFLDNTGKRGGWMGFGGGYDGNLYLTNELDGKGIRFRTAQGEQMVIEENGKVGIGTPSPKSHLHVKGGDWDFKNGGDFRLGSGRNHVKMSTAPGGAGGGSLYLTTSKNAEGGELRMGTKGSVTDLFVSDSHNVGVGTAAPKSHLHVRGGDWDFENGGDFRLGSGRNHVKMSTARGGNGGGNFYLTTSEDAEGGALKMGTRGESNNLVVGTNDNVGIGTGKPSKKLTVTGDILAGEVIVEPKSEIPDYVFDDSYNLPTLKEVSSFIEKKGHLPNVPSAEEVKKNGLHLGEMNTTLLQKVEELTLYAIDQKTRADSLATQLSEQDASIQQLRQTNKQLRERLDRQQEALKAQQRQLEKLKRTIKKISE